MTDDSETIALIRRERDEARAEEEWFREQVTKLFAPWTAEWIAAHPDQPHVHPGFDTLIAWKDSLVLHGAEMAIGRHLEGEATEAALRARNEKLVKEAEAIFEPGKEYDKCCGCSWPKLRAALSAEVQDGPK